MIKSLSPFRALLAVGFAVFGFSAAPAFAQCGYGTSQQDCMHQQRDQEAARQAEYYYRTQQAQQQEQQQDQQFIQGPPPPSQSWVVSYMSIVFHPDADDVWAVWDRRTSQEEADQTALGLCSQMMGDGCEVISGGKGGTVAVARDQSGWLWWEWRDQPGDATRAVMESCGKNGVKCTVFKSVTATHWLEYDNGPREDRARSYSPINKSSLSNIYAMVAWPTADGFKTMDAKWRGKAWLISGSKGYAATKKALIDKCQLATNVDCQVGARVNGGSIVHYKTDSGQGYWLALRSSSEGTVRVASHCDTMNVKCQILQNFDAITQRSLVVDDPY